MRAACVQIVYNIRRNELKYYNNIFFFNVQNRAKILKKLISKKSIKQTLKLKLKLKIYFKINRFLLYNTSRYIMWHYDYSYEISYERSEIGMAILHIIIILIILFFKRVPPPSGLDVFFTRADELRSDRNVVCRPFLHFNNSARRYHLVTIICISVFHRTLSPTISSEIRTILLYWRIWFSKQCVHIYNN